MQGNTANVVFYYYGALALARQLYSLADELARVEDTVAIPERDAENSAAAPDRAHDVQHPRHSLRPARRPVGAERCPASSSQAAPGS